MRTVTTVAEADVLARDERGLPEGLPHQTEWGGETMMPRTFAATVGVGVLLVSDLAAQLSGPTCDEWNTEVFFEAATVENVTACLEAGANVAARDEDKITPLHWASDPAVVEALLAGGADPMAQDQDGQTPLDLAGENDALRSSDIYWRMNDARYNAP